MKIVGVTSCPAGLAHTPMAAKALEKAGENMGHEVLIEQQGAMGTVNKLDQKDIDEANFVLLAADQKVNGMERFKNKKVIKVSLGVCIKAADKVLQKCMKAVGDNNEK